MLARSACRSSRALRPRLAVPRAQASTHAVRPSRPYSRIAQAVGIAGASVFALHASTSTLNCEAAPLAGRPYAAQAQQYDEEPFSEPESIVNVYQLGFGSVAGICVGVFIRKGLKLIAFFLGGGFVFLQYLVSRGLIKVDWSKMGSRYDSLVDRAAGTTRAAPSRAAAVYHRVTDFLLADFPPRATFLAGLALGLRMG